MIDQPSPQLRELITHALTHCPDTSTWDAMAGAVLDAILGPIPADADTATWTAVRAIQLMNEAGRQRDEARAALERVRGFAARLDEFAENALRVDDRKLYAALASDLRAHLLADQHHPIKEA